MSSIRDPAIITNVGRQMMTAGGDITYTKAILYGQDISHLTKEQLEGLTSIGSPLLTVPVGISDKNTAGNKNTVVLESTFQNTSLKADLSYTAVGFFAKRGDGDEKLVAVGVATEGAYLAATSPDGVATDALDIKVAIAIGDSANVTAMIDPAGSVTPTELHNSITDVKTEMHTALDLKADKVDLEPLAKTADVQAGLDTKADKSTVDSDVKSINDTLATKADKQTVTDDLVKKADKTDVDAQIGTVNKSVSDLSDTVKANKDDTDKVLATKADKATVESELSTKANQSDLDKTNAEVAKKASTTDVNSQLATKADAKDVTDALALKDDTVDVDKKISNVTNSVNSLSSTVTSNKSATDTALGTKANANDVANSFEEVRNRVKKLEGQQELTAPDFNTLTSTGIYMIENPTNGKNSPSNGNGGTLVVSRGTTGSDSRILQEYYPDSGDLPYFRMSGPGGVWRDWKQLSDQSEINSLRDAVNTKADKTALDAYAKSADVANDVKTLQDNINAKADAQTVSDAISKIDLTPFAKTADVNSALSGKADKATIDAINKALASKRDITDSYSRDELDKKFLQLSADTGGKVSADQIAKLLASKVDKTDLISQLQAITDSIGTKANSANVTAELAKKDNTADVDAKIKTVTDLANTKANSDGVYSKTEANNLITDAKNTGKQAQATADSALTGYNKRPVISGGASDDLLSFKTTQLRYYPGNGNTCKNLPPATNQQWFTVEYIFENPNGDGIAIYRSPANEIWTIGNNGGNYDQAWVKVANANDIQYLQNQINTKADTATVNSQVADAKNAATKAQDTANQANTNISKIDLSPYAKSADVNSELANKASTTDVSNGLAGKADKSQVNVDGDLFSAPGSITSWASLQADGSKNVLRSVRTEGQGTAFNTDCYDAGILFGGNDTKALISVGYTGNRAIVTGGNNSSVWHEDIAWKSDVTNLQNQVNTKASASDVNSLNQTISALQQTVADLKNTVNQQATQIAGLQTQVNNQANEIKQLQETTIKGKTFSKSQEAAAEAWEKQNSQQIAFILDN